MGGGGVSNGAIQRHSRLTKPETLPTLKKGKLYLLGTADFPLCIFSHYISGYLSLLLLMVLLWILCSVLDFYILWF